MIIIIYCIAWGSLVSAIVPIFPLLDIITNGKIFPHYIHNEEIEGINLIETWILLILSGLLFWFGSVCFIRSFEYPAIEPVCKSSPFKCVHFSTDDLLGAYCFYMGALLIFPVSVIYIAADPLEMTYWAAFIASLMFLIGSAFFVYCCYPTSYREPYFYPIIIKYFGHRDYFDIHCCNDWYFLLPFILIIIIKNRLVTCWLFYFASVVWFLGSIFMLIYTTCDHRNDKEIYLYSSSIFDSILFLIGSMYYCAGSYHLDVLTSNTSHHQDTTTKDESVMNPVDVCFEQKSNNEITEKLINSNSSELI